MLIGAALWAGAALADGDEGSSDSEQLDLEGSIPAQCDFGDLPTGNIGALVPNVEHTLGDFAFTCNLTTSGPVKVTVKSQYGALKRDDGTDTVAYAISWTVLGLAGFTDAGDFDPAVDLFPLSGPNGIAQTAPYKVKVTGSTAGLPAGTYRDTVTYTISP